MGLEKVLDEWFNSVASPGLSGQGLSPSWTQVLPCAVQLLLSGRRASRSPHRLPMWESHHLPTDSSGRLSYVSFYMICFLDPGFILITCFSQTHLESKYKQCFLSADRTSFITLARTVLKLPEWERTDEEFLPRQIVPLTIPWPPGLPLPPGWHQWVLAEGMSVWLFQLCQENKQYLSLSSWGLIEAELSLTS